VILTFTVPSVLAVFDVLLVVLHEMSAMTAKDAMIPSQCALATCFPKTLVMFDLLRCIRHAAACGLWGGRLFLVSGPS
jgi:hypothetical protein